MLSRGESAHRHGPVTARQNAINAVNRAGLIVADMVLEQLAAAEASLSEDDKEFGAALVDITETTGLVIFQRGAVKGATAVFPLGGSHFTNDIAFGLRTLDSGSGKRSNARWEALVVPHLVRWNGTSWLKFPRLRSGGNLAANPLRHSPASWRKC